MYIYIYIYIYIIYIQIQFLCKFYHCYQYRFWVIPDRDYCYYIYLLLDNHIYILAELSTLKFGLSVTIVFM